MRLLQDNVLVKVPAMIRDGKVILGSTEAAQHEALQDMIHRLAIEDGLSRMEWETARFQPHFQYSVFIVPDLQQYYISRMVPGKPIKEIKSNAD